MMDDSNETCRATAPRWQNGKRLARWILAQPYDPLSENSIERELACCFEALEKAYSGKPPTALEVEIASLRTANTALTRERDEAVAQCASVLLLAQTFLCSCPNEGGQHDSDCAVAQLSSFPRAEKLLAVVEAARRAVQWGGTLLLADALRALDQPPTQQDSGLNR